MSFNNASQCNTNTPNGTQFGKISQYNGIPENLVVNLIYWTIGMVIFLLFRQYVAKSYKDDTQLRNRLLNMVTSPTQISRQDVLNLNPFRIVWNVFKLTLDDIGQQCGPEATRYLYFQRFLIGYVTILCVLNLAIILPINFQGTLGANSSQFAATTMMNINAGSPFLYAHVIVQFIGSLIGFGFFIQYTKSSDIVVKATQKTTLMIRKVPVNCCSRELLVRYFNQSIPEVKVIDATIMYPLWEANRAEIQRNYRCVLVNSCDELEEMHGSAGDVTSCCSGHLIDSCCCCSCGNKYNARDYYIEMLNEADREVQKLCEIAMKTPTGIVFVTFESYLHAAIAKDYIKSMRCSSTTPVDIDNEYGVKKWVVKYATEANNVQWESMSEHGFMWYLRIILLNCSLFYLAIILSTPSMVLNTIDKMLTSTEAININVSSFLPTFFINILPVILLQMTSSVLPVVIGYTGYLERHWKRSTRIITHVFKSYFFVLLTVLIIPSLGLMSITGFLRWLFQIDYNEDGFKFQWQCIFLPDNGAFYVNYLITSALMTSVNNLLGLANTLGLWISQLMAESAPMRHAFYQLYTTPFSYNGSYARLLVNLCIVTTYGVICPLVTPVGLLFFISNYYTDKYLIYYASAPTLIKQRIHLAAVRCGSLGMIVAPSFLLVFTILKSETLREPLFIIQLIILIITVVVAILGRHLPLDRIFERALSSLQSIPFLNESLVNERELKFERYYPHYILPFIKDEYKDDHENEKVETDTILEELIDDQKEINLHGSK
ncbi:hypothetical protein ACOME3_003852 [Neoechinorhynchus agilis]